jgi:hypothetical protein
MSVRVTRLGEFLPNGLLFILGVLRKLQMKPKFWAYNFLLCKLCINWWATFLVTNLSGHLDVRFVNCNVYNYNAALCPCLMYMYSNNLTDTFDLYIPSCSFFKTHTTICAGFQSNRHWQFNIDMPLSWHSSPDSASLMMGWM